MSYNNVTSVIQRVGKIPRESQSEKKSSTCHRTTEECRLEPKIEWSDYYSGNPGSDTHTRQDFADSESQKTPSKQMRTVSSKDYSSISESENNGGLRFQDDRINLPKHNVSGSAWGDFKYKYSSGPGYNDKTSIGSQGSTLSSGYTNAPCGQLSGEARYSSYKNTADLSFDDRLKLNFFSQTFLNNRSFSQS